VDLAALQAAAREIAEEVAEGIAEEITASHVEGLKDEMDEEFARHLKRIQKAEGSLAAFRELELLTLGGDKLLTAITKHVVNDGVNAKLRDMRQEFCSKGDLKTTAMKLVSATAFEKAIRELRDALGGNSGQVAGL